MIFSLSLLQLFACPAAMMNTVTAMNPTSVCKYFFKFNFILFKYGVLCWVTTEQKKKFPPI